MAAILAGRVLVDGRIVTNPRVDGLPVPPLDQPSCHERSGELREDIGWRDGEPR